MTITSILLLVLPVLLILLVFLVMNVLVRPYVIPKTDKRWRSRSTTDAPPPIGVQNCWCVDCRSKFVFGNLKNNGYKCLNCGGEITWDEPKEPVVVARKSSVRKKNMNT